MVIEEFDPINTLDVIKIIIDCYEEYCEPDFPNIDELIKEATHFKEK